MATALTVNITAGDITSLDQPLSDGSGTLGDYISDRSKPMEEVISDRMLLAAFCQTA